MDGHAWPTDFELERWLVASAAETDYGAKALRGLMQKDLGFAPHLARDEALAGIVQVFAKRFRQAVINAETPIQTTTLYQPLCEVTWRIVAIVLCSVAELADHAEGYKAPGTILPKDRQDRLKVLIRTNEDLSIKLGEARRCYLRELSEHRDKQRKFNETTKKRLQQLGEQPIMFYEPFGTVLDEPTKEFIRDVVEERVKLGLALELQVPHESEGDVEDDERQRFKDQLERLKDEIRQMEFSRDQFQKDNERMENKVGQYKEQIHNLKEKSSGLEDKNEDLQRRVAYLQKAMEQLQQQNGEMEDLLKNRQEVDESKAAEVSPESSPKYSRPASVKEAVKPGADPEVLELQKKLGEMEKRIKEAERRVKEAELDAAKNSRAPFKVQDQDSLSALKALQEEMAKEKEVELKLQDSNKALEKALADMAEKLKQAEKNARQAEAALQMSKDDMEKYKKRQSKSERPPRDIDEAIRDAVRDTRDECARQLDAKDEEIRRLKGQIDALKRQMEAGQDDEDEERKREENAKWKSKYLDAQDEIERLQKKVKALMDKLRSLDVDMDDVMASVAEFDAPLSRRGKAFQRLYADAKRRMSEMRQREEKLNVTQMAAVNEAADAADDSASLHHVDALASLQEAAGAANARFSSAVGKFQAMRLMNGGSLPSIREAEGELLKPLPRVCPHCGMSLETGSAVGSRAASRQCSRPSSGKLRPTSGSAAQSPGLSFSQTQQSSGGDSLRGTPAKKPAAISRMTLFDGFGAEMASTSPAAFLDRKKEPLQKATASLTAFRNMRRSISPSPSSQESPAPQRDLERSGQQQSQPASARGQQQPGQQHSPFGSALRESIRSSIEQQLGAGDQTPFTPLSSGRLQGTLGSLQGSPQTAYSTQDFKAAREAATPIPAKSARTASETIPEVPARLRQRLLKDLMAATGPGDTAAPEDDPLRALGGEATVLAVREAADHFKQLEAMLDAMFAHWDETGATSTSDDPFEKKMMQHMDELRSAAKDPEFVQGILRQVCGENDETGIIERLMSQVAASRAIVEDDQFKELADTRTGKGCSQASKHLGGLHRLTIGVPMKVRFAAEDERPRTPRSKAAEDMLKAVSQDGSLVAELTKAVAEGEISADAIALVRGLAQAVLDPKRAAKPALRRMAERVLDLLSDGPTTSTPAIKETIDKFLSMLAGEGPLDQIISSTLSGGDGPAKAELQKGLVGFLKGIAESALDAAPTASSPMAAALRLESMAFLEAFQSGNATDETEAAKAASPALRTVAEKFVGIVGEAILPNLIVGAVSAKAPSALHALRLLAEDPSLSPSLRQAAEPLLELFVQGGASPPGSSIVPRAKTFLEAFGGGERSLTQRIKQAISSEAAAPQVLGQKDAIGLLQPVAEDILQRQGEYAEPVTQRATEFLQTLSRQAALFSAREPATSARGSALPPLESATENLLLALTPIGSQSLEDRLLQSIGKGGDAGETSENLLKALAEAALSNEHPNLSARRSDLKKSALAFQQALASGASPAEMQKAAKDFLSSLPKEGRLDQMILQTLSSTSADVGPPAQQSALQTIRKASAVFLKAVCSETLAGGSGGGQLTPALRWGAQNFLSAYGDGSVLLPRRASHQGQYRSLPSFGGTRTKFNPDTSLYIQGHRWKALEALFGPFEPREDRSPTRDHSRSKSPENLRGEVDPSGGDVQQGQMLAAASTESSWRRTNLQSASIRGRSRDRSPTVSARGGGRPLDIVPIVHPAPSRDAADGSPQRSLSPTGAFVTTVHGQFIGSLHSNAPIPAVLDTFPIPPAPPFALNPLPPGRAARGEVQGRAPAAAPLPLQQGPPLIRSVNELLSVATLGPAASSQPLLKTASGVTSRPPGLLRMARLGRPSSASALMSSLPSLAVVNKDASALGGAAVKAIGAQAAPAAISLDPHEALRKLGAPKASVASFPVTTVPRSLQRSASNPSVRNPSRRGEKHGLSVTGATPTLLPGGSGVTAAASGGSAGAAR